MKINTKIFGEIEIDEGKILTFENGIVGFPDLKTFTLVYDVERGDDTVKYLQSLDEPAFAIPVLNPLVVCEDYSPMVDDDLFATMGDLTEDNTLILVTLSVPGDITQMSVNLQGPIVINADTRKACQIIVDENKYPVKFFIYDILKRRKEGK